MRSSVVKKKGDVNIYVYNSKYGGVNHLHERIDGDTIYFQTVQDGLNPGGSTFQLEVEKE